MIRSTKQNKSLGSSPSNGQNKPLINFNTMVVMRLTLSIIFVRGFFAFFFYFLGIILRFTNKKDREKRSPFECGFDALEFFRNPFSIRFFLIAIQFLIFDIEISLAFPMALASFRGLQRGIIINLGVFFFMVTIGFLHE